MMRIKITAAIVGSTNALNAGTRLSERNPRVRQPSPRYQWEKTMKPKASMTGTADQKCTPGYDWREGPFSD